MAKTRTQIQAKYDAAHRTTFSMKLHNENDYDIIKKLSSVPSMQGYIKQLIRQDITGSVPVSVPDSDSVCVFVQGKQDLPTNEDKINVLLSIAEQQNLQSELLKEAQKRYFVPGSSVPVSLSDAAFSMLTEQAEKTGKSVPDLIALIVNTHLLRTYSVPENDNESEEKTMKTYHIKPEYLDLWEGGDMPSNPDRIVTEDDIRTLSDAWEKPVEDLLEQLIPID